MIIDWKNLICGILWGVFLVIILTSCSYTTCPQITPEPIHIDETQDIFDEAYA